MNTNANIKDNSLLNLEFLLVLVLVLSILMKNTTMTRRISLQIEIIFVHCTAYTVHLYMMSKPMFCNNDVSLSRMRSPESRRAQSNQSIIILVFILQNLIYSNKLSLHERQTPARTSKRTPWIFQTASARRFPGCPRLRRRHKCIVFLILNVLR